MQALICLPGLDPGPTLSPGLPAKTPTEGARALPKSVLLLAKGDALGTTQTSRKSLQDASGQEEAKKCESKENTGAFLQEHG